MRVELLGSTEANTPKLVHQALLKGPSLTRDLDTCSFELSEYSEFIAQLGTFTNSVGDIAIFFRECERELHFLHFLFLVDAKGLTQYLPFCGLKYLQLAEHEELVILSGTLAEFNIACLEGTNHADNIMVELFDRIFLILAEINGLGPIMKRYHRETLGSSHLFRLRRVQWNK